MCLGKCHEEEKGIFRFYSINPKLLLLSIAAFSFLTLSATFTRRDSYSILIHSFKRDFVCASMTLMLNYKLQLSLRCSSLHVLCCGPQWFLVDFLTSPHSVEQFALSLEKLLAHARMVISKCSRWFHTIKFDLQDSYRNYAMFSILLQYLLRFSIKHVHWQARETQDLFSSQRIHSLLTNTVQAFALAALAAWSLCSLDMTSRSLYVCFKAHIQCCCHLWF